MERLPRPVALVFPMKTRNRADRPLEAKREIIAFAMADDLTEARRQTRRARHLRARPDRALDRRRRRRRAPAPRSSRLASPRRAPPPRRPTGRSPPAATPARSPAWRSRSRTCSTSPARPPAAGSTILRDAAAGRRRRARRRAPAPRRRGADRPHPHVGVRLLRRRPQSALPGARQPGDARPRPDAARPGRLDLGRRRLGRRRRRLGRARLRHRRLDPHSGRAARPGRLQEHGAAGADRRRRAAVADARHRLGDDALGSRRHRRCTRSSPAARCSCRSAPLRAVALRGADARLMLDGLDATVARAFERSLAALSAAGARIETIELRAAGRDRVDQRQRQLRRRPRAGPSTAAGWPSARPSTTARVALRIRRGETMSAADYIDLVAARRDWIARMDERTAAASTPSSRPPCRSSRRRSRRWSTTTRRSSPSTTCCCATRAASTSSTAAP